MGREFASAAARWLHLADLDVRPEIVARLRHQPRRARVVRAARARAAARRPTTATCSTTPEVEAVYCAVPHHLHAELYVGDPRGRQAPARREAVRDRPRRQQARSWPRSPAIPELLVRCSSELPFFPGGQAVARWIAEGRCGPHPRGAQRSSCTPATSTRTSRSTGSARPSSTASTAAWATSACTRCTCRCAAGWRRATSAPCSRDVVTERPGRRRRDGAVRHAGTTPSCCARRPTTARSRCGSRRSGSRRAR